MSENNSAQTGTRFGEIAVSLGLASAEQIEAALRTQADRKAQGNLALLGDILSEMHVLTPRTVQRIMLEQQRKRRTEPPGGESVSGAAFFKRMDDFELLSKLGEGGMGSVYRARDTGLDRIVALKVLSKRLTESPEFVSRFQREVRSVGKLSHPNIVVAFRSGECDGQPWLAMEFVDGESLRAMMRHAGPLPQVDTVRCFRDIARALAHAHASNLIHRDVKPDNILIAKDGTAKLADLGLAKSVQDDEKLTATGIALGTPHYISPEQACGLKDADFRSDLYSLGASMFHALVGRPVFPAENKSEVMRHHVQTPPPDPRSLRADLTPELCAVILKLLSKKPEERYASAADVADDLDRILRGNPPKHAHVAAPSPAAEEAAPKRGRRPAAKRAKTRSGCLVLIIALLTIGWRLAEWLEKIIAT